MVRKPQISVIGYDAKLCTDAAYEAAYRVGVALAKRGAVLINGGLEGVMEAASKGATEAGGLAIGIIPSDEAAQANRY
ncbi:MAG: TIGR00725 family protein, partial [Nitrososphaerales archaeon]